MSKGKWVDLFVLKFINSNSFQNAMRCIDKKRILIGKEAFKLPSKCLSNYPRLIGYCIAMYDI